MARVKITREYYENLVSAFRERPGIVSEAASVAAVSRKTAQKAWVQGWPEYGFPPIRERLEQEATAVRARLAEQAEREAATKAEQAQVAKAQVDATATREREALIVRASRENVIGYLKATNDLMHGAVLLSGMIREELAQMAKKGSRPPMKQAVYLMNAIGSALRQGNEAATLALRMERLLAGEPEAILGVKDMSIDQCAKEMQLAQKAMERVAKKTGLSLVPPPPTDQAA